jgi:Cu-Zn family superoxide dismutase
MKNAAFFIFLALLLAGSDAWAEQVVINMHLLNAKGVGASIGTVTASESPYGVLFTPKLKGLTPGLHGFHVHALGDCGPKEKGGKMVPGLAAGGHYDPANTGIHLGPYGEGHLGDLPALYVDKTGHASHPVLAPRLKLADLQGHALIIHAGGDNYSDKPEALGGGGARAACGLAAK